MTKRPRPKLRLVRPTDQKVLTAPPKEEVIWLPMSGRDLDIVVERLFERAVSIWFREPDDRRSYADQRASQAGQEREARRAGRSEPADPEDLTL